MSSLLPVHYRLPLPLPTVVPPAISTPGRHAGRREDRERAGASPQRANSCRPQAGLG